MVQEIVWSDDALFTLGKETMYLIDNFSQKELDKFKAKIDAKLLLLKSDPRRSTKIGKRPNTFKTVINKRVVLYYQYKPRKKVIVLLTFWNTLQDPKRLRI